jgi:hypothetical protein
VNDDALDALYMLYQLVMSQGLCDFRNGVTDPSGTFDEGEEQAEDILETARQVLMAHEYRLGHLVVRRRRR